MPKTLEEFPTNPFPYVNNPTRQEIFDWFKQEESIRYKAYPDGGKFSIGLGHQIKVPEENYLLTATITQDQVLQLFDKDIQWTVAAINKNVKVPLNKNQKLALMSIVYNVGEPNFKRTNLLKELNKGNYNGAAFLIPTTITTSQGIFNPVIATRRKKEQALFNKPV
jgi:lysozyme